MSLDFNLIEKGPYAEVQLSGSPLSELDFEDVHSAMDRWIEQHNANVIINLEKVNVLNSLGLNALIKMMTKCRNHGGDLYIVNISEKINHVLLLTKLNTVLNIAPSVEKAAENLKLTSES